MYIVGYYISALAMEMKTGTDRTWRLLKRRAKASLAAKLKLAGSPSQVCNLVSAAAFCIM